MEIGLSGGSLRPIGVRQGTHGRGIQLRGLLRRRLPTDVVAVTKGYGWQGVIRRFGGKLSLTRTPRSAVSTVTWVTSVPDTSTRPSVRVARPLPPAHGIQQAHPPHFQSRRAPHRQPAVSSTTETWVRTTSSSRGSLPGPAKRLIRFRDASRAENMQIHDYEITYVSTASKQGA